MTFAETWAAIQTNLASGAEIKNWTAAKGYLGDSFTISRVSSNCIVVSSPGAENEQSVPKRDFEILHAVWLPYCAGSVQRQEVRDKTRFSKYIISILRHVEKPRQAPDLER